MARTHTRRLSWTVALGAALVMATVGSTMAGPDTGELPVAGFTHSSVVDDTVAPAPDSLADVYSALANGDLEHSVGVDLHMSGPTAVTTTYTIQPVDRDYRFGWHSNNGPVILTVTTGTLTLLDDTCRTFDVAAGHTFVWSTGQVLDARVVPDKNPGVPAVGWFTTRLHPVGTADSVEVDAPCAM